jgi:predicted GIY-YIG superfamily endonuclease
MIGLETLPATPGVYQITCVPTGDTYIGSSKNMLVRVRSHTTRCATNSAIYTLHGQHGPDSFRVDILERCESGPKARIAEMRHICERMPSLNNPKDKCGRRITVFFPPDRYARFIALCESKGVSPDEFVRNAVNGEIAKAIAKR